ncbi:TPA: hypothetical protein HA278_00840 [Candidatus Woesearchaeota archaeon]|nr:hypothetical protein [archaeon]HIJ10577.1 hypothetical protein [Candidatus Woesearchaeota archaeon]|tara:strand:+ start:250 stop:783 length:534 start_codon:yes stop_codon:yes gene_type:complete
MADIAAETQQLRSQGLPDPMIMKELTEKGFPPEQVHAHLSQMDATPTAIPPSMGAMPPMPSHASSTPHDQMYSRIEEVTETLIDEKWDQLIGEVRKIVEWKTQIEMKQRDLENTLTKLKEDFGTLHKGVLGKLDSYDGRMQDVGTELKAVGKVFKDVVPVFVENVKELGRLKDGIKK